MDNRKTKKTLLLSIILSLPAPFIVGFSLFIGNSSTQIADFIRRTSELISIIIAFIVYSITSKDGFTNERKKLKYQTYSNILVGIMILLAGSIMLLITLFSKNTSKGNVAPALAIAILGIISNSYFFRKYRLLYKKEFNPILEIQAKLYFGKCLIDLFVSIPLTIILLSPEGILANIIDMIGSSIVATYLIICGLRTILEKMKIRKFLKLLN